MSEPIRPDVGLLREEVRVGGLRPMTAAIRLLTARVCNWAERLRKAARCIGCGREAVCVGTEDPGESEDFNCSDCCCHGEHCTLLAQDTP